MKYLSHCQAHTSSRAHMGRSLRGSPAHPRRWRIRFRETPLRSATATVDATERARGPPDRHAQHPTPAAVARWTYAGPTPCSRWVHLEVHRDPRSLRPTGCQGRRDRPRGPQRHRPLGRRIRSTSTQDRRCPRTRRPARWLCRSPHCRTVKAPARMWAQRRTAFPYVRSCGRAATYVRIVARPESAACAGWERDARAPG